MNNLFRNYLAESLQREIAELKISHARELEYVTKELTKAQDEYQRLVRTVLPTMQTVSLPKEIKETENEAPPAIEGLGFGGTPFDRVKAAYMKQLEDEDKAKTKPSKYIFTGEGPVKTQEN